MLLTSLVIIASLGIALGIHSSKSAAKIETLETQLKPKPLETQPAKQEATNNKQVVADKTGEKSLSIEEILNQNAEMRAIFTPILNNETLVKAWKTLEQELKKTIKKLYKEKIIKLPYLTDDAMQSIENGLQLPSDWKKIVWGFVDETIFSENIS